MRAAQRVVLVLRLRARETFRMVQDQDKFFPFKGLSVSKDRKAFTDFTERLRRAQDARKGPEYRGGRSGAMGIAFRLVVELVAGLVVGGFIGWLLDQWLGTSPFLLLLFFFLGTAAGIMNVIRAASAMQVNDGNDSGMDGN